MTTDGTKVDYTQPLILVNNAVCNFTLAKEGLTVHLTYTKGLPIEGPGYMMAYAASGTDEPSSNPATPHYEIGADVTLSNVGGSSNSTKILLVNYIPRYNE